MTFMSSRLDPARVADLAADPDWAPHIRKAVDMPAAERAYADLQAALVARAARLAQTCCPLCGGKRGPGDSSTSSHIDHASDQQPQRTQPCTPGLSYAEFGSEFLGTDVRIGYQWHDADEHAYYPQPAELELNEIWIGDADLGPHLVQASASELEDELREHLQQLSE